MLFDVLSACKAQKMTKMVPSKDGSKKPGRNPTPELAGSQSPIASRQSPIANRQEESELAARQGKILDLKNLKKNVSHFLVLKDWQKNLVTF